MQEFCAEITGVKPNVADSLRLVMGRIWSKYIIENCPSPLKFEWSYSYWRGMCSSKVIDPVKDYLTARCGMVVNDSYQVSVRPKSYKIDVSRLGQMEWRDLKKQGAREKLAKSRERFAVEVSDRTLSLIRSSALSVTLEGTPSLASLIRSCKFSDRDSGTQQAGFPLSILSPPFAGSRKTDFECENLARYWAGMFSGSIAQRWDFLRDGSGWRFHYPITRMPRELRARLRHVTGEPLFDLDVTSCQLAMIGGLSQRGRQGRSVASEIRMGWLPQLGGVPAWATERWMQAVAGDLYQQMGDDMGMTRDEAKHAMIILMFCEPEKVVKDRLSAHVLVAKAWMQEWHPQILDWTLRARSRKGAYRQATGQKDNRDYAVLALATQRAEASVMIDRVPTAMSHLDKVYLPIHDGCLTNDPSVAAVMRDQFQKFLGLPVVVTGSELKVG